MHASFVLVGIPFGRRGGLVASQQHTTANMLRLLMLIIEESIDWVGRKQWTRLSLSCSSQEQSKETTSTTTTTTTTTNTLQPTSNRLLINIIFHQTKTNVLAAVAWSLGAWSLNKHNLLQLARMNAMRQDSRRAIWSGTRRGQPPNKADGPWNWPTPFITIESKWRKEVCH